MMQNIHEVDGYGIVLAHVQNYYPVEECGCNAQGVFSWGFKYTSGVFEYFHYTNEGDAEEARDSFVHALNNYLGDAKRGG